MTDLLIDIEKATARLTELNQKVAEKEKELVTVSTEVTATTARRNAEIPKLENELDTLREKIAYEEKLFQDAEEKRLDAEKVVEDKQRELQKISDEIDEGVVVMESMQRGFQKEKEEASEILRNAENRMREVEDRERLSLLREQKLDERDDLLVKKELKVSNREIDLEVADEKIAAIRDAAERDIAARSKELSIKETGVVTKTVELQNKIAQANTVTAKSEDLIRQYEAGIETNRLKGEELASREKALVAKETEIRNRDREYIFREEDLTLRERQIRQREKALTLPV